MKQQGIKCQNCNGKGYNTTMCQPQYNDGAVLGKPYVQKIPCPKCSPLQQPREKECTLKKKHYCNNFWCNCNGVCCQRISYKPLPPQPEKTIEKKVPLATAIWAEIYQSLEKEKEKKIRGKIEDILEKFYHDELQEMDDSVDDILALFQSKGELHDTSYLLGYADGKESKGEGKDLFKKDCCDASIFPENLHTVDCKGECACMIDGVKNKKFTYHSKYDCHGGDLGVLKAGKVVCPKGDWAEIRKKFKKLCIVNEFGECKYWNPESFGYAKDDMECSMDKFFPEKVLAFFKDLLEKKI